MEETPKKKENPVKVSTKTNNPLQNRFEILSSLDMEDGEGNGEAAIKVVVDDKDKSEVDGLLGDTQVVSGEREIMGNKVENNGKNVEDSTNEADGEMEEHQEVIGNLEGLDSPNKGKLRPSSLAKSI